MTSERVGEIRSMVAAEENGDLADFKYWVRATKALLAERDRLAAEVGAARAVADEMHVNMRRIRNERDDLLAALEKIKRHGCCVMHSDSGCPGCTAHDALARLGGGGK